MNLTTNFTLSAMSDRAKETFDTALERVDKADDALALQMKGNSTGRILGGVVGSLLWMAAFVIAALYAVEELSNPIFALVSAGASLIMMLLIFVEGLTKTRYYGSISRTRDKLNKIRRRLEVGKSDLSADLDDLMESRSRGWDFSLMAGESVYAELEDVEQDLAAMTALKTGLLQKLRPIFYYVACLGWTLVSCFLLESLLVSILGGELSDSVINVIYVILTAVTLIAEIFIARLAWSSTDCTVTNVTVFAVLAGPILFGVLCLASGLVALLLGLVLSLLKLVIGAAIGLAILSGVCSGG